MSSNFAPLTAAFQRSVLVAESRDPFESSNGSLTALQLAKWKLAVLVELAQPGHMQLTAAIGADGQVLDFTWLEASPTSTLALGCDGEDLAGRSLRRVLANCKMDASAFVAYREAYDCQCSREALIESKEGMVLHQITPSLWGVTIKVTSSTAVERVLLAQQAVSQLESNDFSTHSGRLR